MLAAAAEKQGLKSKYMSQGAGIAEKMGMKVKVPSLKDLVTKPGAIAGMLRAIMNFLKLRFPAFLGMNVLWSLALFGTYLHPSPPARCPPLPSHYPVHISTTDTLAQSSSSSSGTVTNAAAKPASRKSANSPKPKWPPSKPTSPPTQKSNRAQATASLTPPRQSKAPRWRRSGRVCINTVPRRMGPRRRMRRAGVWQGSMDMGRRSRRRSRVRVRVRRVIRRQISRRRCVCGEAN